MSDFSTEIARRTVRIRLDARIDRPWQRDPAQFRHPNIINWVKQNRGELIWAALILTKAWIAAGCPEPKGIKPLGSFEEYSRVIGGILQVAGVKGFLGNADEFYESSDSEGADLRFFVSGWWERFQGKPVGVSEIYKLIMESDIQMDLGNGKGERSQKTSLGRILSSLRDRHIGEYRVVFGGSKNGAKLWKLIGQEISTDVLNEHHEHGEDVQLHVHCEPLTLPDDISSQSSSIPDPFYHPKKIVHKSNLTPLICREGCIHYDGVKNTTDGIFKEFCWYRHSHRLEGSRPCEHFEDENWVCDDDPALYAPQEFVQRVPVQQTGILHADVYRETN